LVAALAVQATIALLGVLPNVPSAPDLRDLSDGYYVGYSQPVTFWVQFAMVEFIAAVVISLALGPGVRLSRVPAIAQLVLGLGFVLLPAAALVLGGIDAAQIAAKVGPAVAASSWLSTATFGILFFGLPLIALVAPAGRATTKAA
jgi:fatty acid desaturase